MIEIDKDMLEWMTPHLTERAGKIYIQNEDYKQFSKNADLIFEKLNETLTSEQKKLLDQYFVENDAAVALAERIVYQQGMRDLFNLFISLLKDGKSSQD